MLHSVRQCSDPTAACQQPSASVGLPARKGNWEDTAAHRAPVFRSEDLGFEIPKSIKAVLLGRIRPG